MKIAKRFKLFILATLFLVLVVAVLTCISKTGSQAPRFVPGSPKWLGSQQTTTHYAREMEPLFLDGKVWLYVTDNLTNHQIFYDIDRKQILGELLNSQPLLYNRDQTMLLCEGVDSLLSIKVKLTPLLDKLSKGRIQLDTNVATFWILDLKRNSARRVGEINQPPGLNTGWHPSPTFRYGYNVPFSFWNSDGYLLCDLKTGGLKKLQFKGQLEGWWDGEEILARDTAHNFVLLNVKTLKTTMLLTTEELVKLFNEIGMDINPAELNVDHVWNGNEYDFYLREQSRNSIVAVKLRHDKSLFKVVGPALEYYSLDYLDASGTLHLYEGLSASSDGMSNAGIYLHNLTNHTTRTILEPGGSKDPYAHFHFYRDNIIYYRSNQIWRTDLNGSNNVPAFPLRNQQTTTSPSPKAP